MLLFAATKRINGFNLHTQELTSIADNLDHVIGVGYHDDYVYWTDISYQVERIMRARIDGSDKMVSWLWTDTFLLDDAFGCLRVKRDNLTHF